MVRGPSHDDGERQEASLRAERRFRWLYEQTPTPYITVAPDSAIVDLNDAAEVLLGSPRAHVVATTVDRLVEQPDRGRLRAFVAAMFASGRGRARCEDVTLRRVGSSPVVAMIDGVVLPADPDEPPRAVLAIIDVTARKLVETARRRAQDEVLAIVSHDLRGPISSIGLACDGLAGELPHDEHQECVAAIRRAVARSERLIEDLLRVAHIESGRLELRRARFDVRGLVAQVCRDHEPAAAAAGSVLTVALDERPCPVDGDRDRLHQVLANLLGNALVHARGAAIQVSVVAHDAAVVIAVADDGPGIPADELPAVFERYRQGARRRAGAGLGLTIVKGLVEAHGGTVTVTSQRGCGARFEITLSRTDPPRASAPRDPPAV